MIYLALYKGCGSSLFDRLKQWSIRRLTRGKYSHCELVECLGDDVYRCWGSQPGKGVVSEVKTLPKDEWDLLPVTEDRRGVVEVFEATEGLRYDWRGCISILTLQAEDKEKYFCSEWCAKALGFEEAWRFSPNDLNAIYFNNEVNNE